MNEKWFAHLSKWFTMIIVMCNRSILHYVPQLKLHNFSNEICDNFFRFFLGQRMIFSKETCENKLYLWQHLLSVYLPLILSSSDILQFTMYRSFGLSAALLHLLPIYLFTFSLWRHISELTLRPEDFIVNCNEQCPLRLQLLNYGGNIKIWFWCVSLWKWQKKIKPCTLGYGSRYTGF